MAPVTRPASGNPAPPTRLGRRRWWLGGLAGAWIVVLGGLAVWSVGNGPPTVPEQRNIGQAVPELQRAAGAVFAAAGGPGRAVELGELEIAQGCRITAVRDGAVAVRDITVHVRAGEARVALESIATRLPAAYAAEATTARAGTRFSLYADAGNFIGIDADTEAAAQAVSVRVSTGCRPLGGDDPAADPSGGPPPDALTSTLTRLGAGDAVLGVSAVACPAGGMAGTWTVEDVAAPADLPGRLTGDVRDGPEVWAFRTGNDSVVVARDGPRLRVSASTTC